MDQAGRPRLLSRGSHLGPAGPGRGGAVHHRPRSAGRRSRAQGGCGVISYAVSYIYIYMDRFLARKGIGSVMLSARQLAAEAVVLAIVLAVSGAQTPHVTAEDVAAIAVLGIIGTGFAYVLNYQIITSEGATVASTVTYLLPVVGAR